MAFPQRKRTPSFSSSVLDSIYRSIDESDGLQCDLRGGGSIKNNTDYVSTSSSSASSLSSSPTNQKDDKLTTLRRAIMDDQKWLYTRKSTTSSDSSVFSSSGAESYRPKRRSRKVSDQGNRPGEETQRTKKTPVLDNDKTPKAVKILDELKRSKQPVSPGARLTSFLNSIFQSNAKKVKLCSVRTTTDVKSSSSPSCFSRTKNKTDNNNNNNNLKSSVRFYPVRVTIDGDCRHTFHENITIKKKTIPEFTTKKSVTSVKEEIKTKVDQTELTCVTRNFELKDSVRSYKDEGKEEEDDAWSYSSSDLFEIDNHRIGMARYIKELPVYETTDFNTNQAIARGLLF